MWHVLAAVALVLVVNRLALKLGWDATLEAVVSGLLLAGLMVVLGISFY